MQIRRKRKPNSSLLTVYSVRMPTVKTSCNQRSTSPVVIRQESARNSSANCIVLTVWGVNLFTPLWKNRNQRKPSNKESRSRMLKFWKRVWPHLLRDTCTWSSSTDTPSLTILTTARLKDSVASRTSPSSRRRSSNPTKENMGVTWDNSPILDSSQTYQLTFYNLTTTANVSSPWPTGKTVSNLLLKHWLETFQDSTSKHWM